MLGYHHVLGPSGPNGAVGGDIARAEDRRIGLVHDLVAELAGIVDALAVGVVYFLVNRKKPLGNFIYFSH